jgi:hypothetical protein
VSAENTGCARAQPRRDGTFNMALPTETRWSRSTDWLVLMSAHVSNVPIGLFPAILETIAVITLPKMIPTT